MAVVNPTFVLTDAGTALYNTAILTQTPLVLDSFAVGSAFGYAPLPTDTALHGTTLYSAPFSTWSVLDTDVLDILMLMDVNVGPFSFGEIGIYSGATLYALASYPVLQTKTATSGAVVGNRWKLHALLKQAQGTTIINVQTASPLQLLEVASWATLPAPISVPSGANAAIIHEADPTGKHCVVYKRDDYTWDVTNYTRLALGEVLSSPTANTFTSNLFASMLLDGATPNKYLVRFETGDIRSISAIAGTTATVNGTVPSYGTSTVIEVLVADNTPYVQGNGSRQSIISGRTDAQGNSNFLVAGTGLSLDLEADSNYPFSVTWAYGYDASTGYPRDFVMPPTLSKVSGAWSGLPANSSIYLFYDRDPATGNVSRSWGYTPMYYGYSFLPNDSVPNMSSNSGPSGVANASSALTNRDAYKAFDSHMAPGTGWASNNTTTGWLSYMFPTSQVAKHYEVLPKVDTTTNKQNFASSSYSAASYQFVVPTGVTSITASGIGGGGGGAGGGTRTAGQIGYGGYGGQNGTYVGDTVITVVPGETLQIDIGAGGVGGYNSGSTTGSANHAATPGGTTTITRLSNSSIIFTAAGGAAGSTNTGNGYGTVGYSSFYGPGGDLGSPNKTGIASTLGGFAAMSSFGAGGGGAGGSASTSFTNNGGKGSPGYVTLSWSTLNNSNAPASWTFEGSPDGASWTVLDTQAGHTNWSGVRKFSLSNTTAYKYYRMNISAVNSGTMIEVDDLMIAVAGQAMFHLGHKKCFVYGGDGDYTPIQRIDVGAATLGATTVTSVASNTIGERSLRSDNTSSLVPVGAMVLFPFKNPPEGYLVADGSDLSRQTYGSLFGRIGTTFGSGDGINTFSLPDYRGVVFRGYDAGRGVDVDRNMFLEQPGSAMVTVPLSTVTGPTGIDFTTPGGPYTWTVPANVTSISIFVIGGGGGGSGSYYYWGGGSGGGAGGYVLAMLNVTPGQQLTINVGAGGAGSTTLGVGAVNGGNTTVTTAGVSIIGYGGKASYWNQAGAGGGKSASGVTVVKSGNGNAGQIGSWPYNSGTGGSSYYTTLFGTSTAGAGYVGDGNHATGGLGSYGGGGGGGSWYGYVSFGYNYGYGYGYYGGWGDGSWYYWDWGLSAGGAGGHGMVAISYTPSVNSISAGAGPIYGIFSIGSTPELTMRNAALLPCIKY